MNTVCLHATHAIGLAYVNAIDRNSAEHEPRTRHDETLAQSSPGDDVLVPQMEGAYSVSSLHASIGVSSIKTGLHDQEASQARTIGIVFTIIGGLAASWSPFLGGHSVAQVVFVTMMILLTGSSLYIWRIGSQPEKYGRRIFRLYGLMAVLSSFCAMLYLGPFSPTALAITLGIGFFGQGNDRVGAWMICCGAIVLSECLFLGIMLGLFPDVGIFAADEISLGGRLFMTVMVPVVLFVTLLQASWSRSAVQLAMQSAVESIMEVGRRDIQLQEAQAELDRLFASDGLLGRMTGESMGNYRLGPLLGRGATGEVYDAVEVSTSARAAIKILNCPDADDDELIARFQQEGEINRKLLSPNVVHVEEYGKDPSGRLYIVMERLHGDDLAAILRRQDRMELAAVLSMVNDVCLGLAAAHAHGVVHRDIKPHNIFLHEESDQRSNWKILDFGVSKWSSSAQTLTRVGGVVGTPRYMSPEQARGEPVDQRADIYGLGAVLYRVLTGRPPFTGRGNAVLFSAAHRRPPRPRSIAPELSRQLETVLAISMAPNPQDRFDDVGGLRRAFGQAVIGQLPSTVSDIARTIPWRAANPGAN